MRVLIIDDHEVERLGRAAVLGPHYATVATATWSELEADNRRLDPADVVLAIVRPDPTSWDGLAAIASTNVLSDFAAGPARVIAAIAGGEIVHPLIRVRLANAGAHEIVDLSELVDGPSMVEALEQRIVCRPDPSELVAVSVDPSTDPDAVLSYLAARAAEQPEILDAFDPAVTRTQSGVTRRQSHTLRRRICELGALIARDRHDTGGKHRDLSLARWSRVVEFVNICRAAGPVESIVADRSEVA